MKSASELAALLGVNEATLRLWRAEAGIPAKARNVGYSEDEEARIREIAAKKRKSKPRKGDSAPEMPRIVTERQIYAPLSADSPDMYRAFDSAFSATTGTNSALIPTEEEISAFGYDDALARLRGSSTNPVDHSAQLERIESKIDALTALLERAAIAPRYVKRETVEDALDERPKRAYTKHQNKPMRANGMRLALFAGLHGVNERTARDQVKVQEAYEVTIVPTNSHQEYYVEEHQKAAIIAYWKRTGYPFSPCPECPHTQEVQEHE